MSSSRGDGGEADGPSEQMQDVGGANGFAAATDTESAGSTPDGSQTSSGPSSPDKDKKHEPEVDITKQPGWRALFERVCVAVEEQARANEAAERAGVCADAMECVAVPAEVGRGTLTAAALVRLDYEVARKLQRSGLRLDYFGGAGAAGEIVVRECSGHMPHGKGVGEVFRVAANAVVAADPDRMYCSAVSDVSIGGAGGSRIAADLFTQGQGGARPVLFAGEVECGHRSTMGLVRHLGTLFATYPTLNGMIGVKVETYGGLNLCTLVAVRMEGVGAARHPVVTHLTSFGPDEVPPERKARVEQALRRPRPAAGQRPVAVQHGLGAQQQSQAELRALWRHFPSGVDANTGQRQTHTIPVAQLVAGAAHLQNGDPLALPAGAPDAVIDLSILCRLLLRG